MAVKVQQVLEILEQIAPPELACSWDNVGLLVDAGRPVTSIMTALDITADVVRDAAESGCELIVSHHPVIFDPLRRVTAEDVPAMLLQNGISAICMHTNLDAAPGGVNDVLADLLRIENRRDFADNCGRIGKRLPLSFAHAGEQPRGKLCLQRTSLVDDRLRLLGAQQTGLTAVTGHGFTVQIAFLDQSVDVDRHKIRLDLAQFYNVACRVAFRIVSEEQQDVKRSLRQVQLAAQRVTQRTVCQIGLVRKFHVWIHENTSSKIDSLNLK